MSFSTSDGWEGRKSKDVGLAFWLPDGGGFSYFYTAIFVLVLPYIYMLVDIIGLLLGDASLVGGGRRPV